MLKKVSRIGKAAIFAAIVFTSAISARSKELVIAKDGKSNYQIVIPDSSPDKAIEDSLKQAGRLLQTSFTKSGFNLLPIVKEKDRVSGTPAIFLGDTKFARKHGVDTEKLEGWSYYIKVVGSDVIIAGHDHASPEITDPKLKGGSHGDFYYRIGTIKALTDFLREYMGTYFLYPGVNVLPSRKNSRVREWKITDVADIAYTKKSVIKIQANLNLHKKVFLTSYVLRRATSLYHIANNYFPAVDNAVLGHTHGLAIPAKKYYDTHPEYFAMIGKTRPRPPGSNVHLCYSNPEVPKILYQWHKKWLDMGFRSVSILQDDGFRGCQCEKCKKLFGVGDDNWAEKIWIIHRDIAERLNKAYPDRKVLLGAYAFAAHAPKTFKKFPPNVIIQNIDAVNHDTEIFKEWHKVHKGEYSNWSHNWCGNLTTRFTPMRTPGFLEKQAKWFYKNDNRSIFRDGFGIAFGLEGPSYYIFGRMFDDPENLRAKDLMYEFCGAAFGEAGPTMRRFYDKINYHIELYSSYLGTHGIGWTYKDIYGRKHKSMKDPFRFLAFLFPPRLLNALEAELSLAEKKAKSPQSKKRLELVRREFNYHVDLMKVIHLYQAFTMNPDLGLRKLLLKAIGKRNKSVATMFHQKGKWKGRQIQMKGWGRLLFPPQGYNQDHMQLNFDSYQHPFKNTALNWDTEAVRKSPLPGTMRKIVAKVATPPVLFGPEWSKAKATPLKPLPGFPGTRATTSCKLLYDAKNLYIRFTTKLPKTTKTFNALTEDDDFSQNESVDIYLAPLPGQEIFYRFKVGADPKSKYDAANGLIKDQLNLLFGKDDKRWSGEWKYESKINTQLRWAAMVTIPFKTMGIKPPTAGDRWRGNIGRNHAKEAKLPMTIWSAVGGCKGVGDKASFGIFEFGGDLKERGDSGKNKCTVWRDKYNKDQKFDFAAICANLKNQLPGKLGPWKLKFDELEKGVSEKWYAVDFDDISWKKVTVPSFWAENATGNFTGYGWCRVSFVVPENWKGKSLKIMFGGVDEQAWVYFNGKLVKEHSVKSEKLDIGQLWETPFAAEIKPELIKYGKKNVLAVKISNAKANGGIWRPVAVFAVEEKTK